jgi:hydroxymethylpyrimidine/phosphomethylpyrimidine kinase
MVAAQYRPDAIKTGALATAPIVEAVARALRRMPAPVVDPVMVSSSGKRLITKSGAAALRVKLIPLARIVTPNLPEAEALTGIKIEGPDSIRAAARAIIALGAQAVVIKGGHLHPNAPALDLFYDGKDFIELKAKRIPGGHQVHGTGCAFSAAIAASLARGESLENSVRRAKAYVTRAIHRQIQIGHARPLLDHLLQF